MKLVNISSKVIAIGSNVVMPDKSANVKVLTPGIKSLVKAGFLRVDDSEEKAKEEAAKAAKEAAEKEAAEAKAKAEAEAKAKAEAEAKAKAEAKAAEEKAKKEAAKATESK